jgi:DNA processing protein
LLQVPRIGPVLAERIARAPSESEIIQLLELCQTHGIRIVCPQDPDYPELLRELTDPPAVLFLRGELKAEDRLAVAIVGTRHPTPYGLRQAERLAAGLAAAGFTIVSGLARGIDAAAHRGALQAGGRTLAVLASGLLRIYPPEHRQLADEIEKQGALLSEALPQQAPLGTSFPKRNRIISGLAWGTIVVEAGTKSGALITAHHAMEQGREVFAVPGRADDRTAQGCNRLIRDGATMVLTPEDVIETLRPMIDKPSFGLGRRSMEASRSGSRAVADQHPAKTPELWTAAGNSPNSEGTTSPRPINLSEIEQKIYQAVAYEPTSIDQIVALTGLPSSQVLATISLLELRQLLRRLGGNWVCRR